MYNIKELRAEVKRLQEEIDGKLKDAFKETSDILFRNHSNLESISWNQYTPYFNDGEECIFRAQNEYPSIKFVGRDDAVEDISLWSLKQDSFNRYLDVPLTEDELETAKAVLEFTSEFESDELKTMFGDHVTVTVTKDGAETDICHHD